MDPPPPFHHRRRHHHHHHHHHRYVPHPPNFPDSNPSNFFSHHRLPPPPPPLPPPPHHHLPPPPPLPPPPSLPPPPPPQHFALHHHHRPRPPIDDHLSQNSNFIPPHLLSPPPPPPPPPPSSRVSASHRNEDNTNFNNNFNNYHRQHNRWVEPPPRVRVLPDQQFPPPPPPPPPPHDNGYHPGLSFRPDIDDFERNDGFLDEFYGDDRFMNNTNGNHDVSVVNNDEERRWARKDLDFDIIGDDERYSFAPGDRYRNVDCFDESLSRRDCPPNVGNYEVYDERDEDPRWGRYSPRNVGMETDNMFGSSRRELFLDSFGSGRFRDNDRAREGRQGFFSRSPRKKQVQKKSALLRIQLGKGIKSNRNRNRVHESSQYSKGYFDESSSAGAGLWGEEKDGLVQSDCRVEEKREKSPVQLDVSFKSNSLVAKAIVTPSSPTVDCRSSTPRNRKIRKINFSSSPLTKPSENSCKPNNSVTGSDGPSISGKRRKLSSDNIVSADGSASGCGPQPGSSGSNDVAEKATTTGSPKMKALDGDGNSAGASGTPFRRIIQRKKITATPLHESVPQPLKDTDELTKADKSMGNPTAVSQLDEGMKHPGQSDASAVRVSAHGIVLSHCSNEAGSVSEKNDTDVDSSRPFSAAFPNSSSHSNTDSYTSQSKVDTVITDEADQADRSNHNSGSVSNLDTSLVQLQSKSALSGSDRLVEFTKHPCQDGGPLPENALRGGSFEVSVLVEGYLNSILSSTKKMGIPVVYPDTSNPDIDDHSHIYASDHAENIVTDSKPECSEKAGVIAVDDVGASDPGTKEFLGNQTIVSFENDAHENVKNLNCSNHSLGVTRLTISSSTGCLGQGNISDPCSLDDGSKKSCFDLSTVPLDNDHGRGPLKAVVSVGFSEDNSQKVERKRKTSDALLNLYGSGASDVPVNVGSCINGEDEGIISLVNDVCAAKEAFHPDYHNDTLCGDSLGGDPLNVIVSDQDAFGIDANVFPIYGKKRKPDEGPDTAATSTLSSNVSSCVDNGTSASEVRIVLESADLLSSLLPTGTLNENSTARASFQAQSTGDGASKKSKILELLSSCSPQFGADPEKDAASAISVTNHQFGTVYMVSQGSANQLCDTEMDQRVPGKDCECVDSLTVKDNLESVLNHPSLCDNGEGASAVNSVDELIDSFSDSRSHMCSPENLAIKSPSEVDDFKPSVSHISDDNVCQNDKELHKRPLSASDSELDRRAGQGIARKPPIGIKTASSLSKGTSKVTPNLNSVWVKSNLSNNYLSSSVPQVFSGHPSLNFTASRKAATLNHIAKPRTWHRTGNPSGSVRGPMTQLNPIPQQNNTRKKVGTLQSSYTRKGNSLVRNPSPIAAVSKGVHASGSLVYRFNSSGVDDSKKGKESDANPQISTIHGGSLATNERPQTPPLCLANKSLSTAALSLNDSTSLPGAEPTESFSAVTTSGPLEFTTNMNLLKSSEEITKSSGLTECHTGSIKNYEGQSTQDEKNLGKNIIYVKRRSNQLVAALGAGDVSLRCVDKAQASSDGYYKRRKNQLIRRLLENHVEESVAAADDSQKQDNQKFKQSGKSNSKSYKPFKFSLVWTLRETESSKSDVSSVRCHKAWPYLFPWKRATYRRNSMFIPNDTSLSLISRKLLLSRKRETIYTRSTDGFSLRRSKVLSVGGSNLKWSKSIERNSKKANEEATLAVAAAEKSKKEQNVAASTVLNRRNHVSRKSVYCIKLRPGERIFRIGSERYKMDPTRNTLHRITNDEDHLCPVPQPEENAKKSYVPRRLLIGNDEYVRVGNGNKLVRDPKKRTRTLASEKVRWSLHTVRLRLAKRRKYCQFFTRFGKCNKEDGKCPYIHDPSKIAVCTKFLNSSCSNPNCKLTHKVMPERMPDCSYFLQGLCSNENCPYRHVNVNPSASICEGFRRGYCADGNECRKKHTYVCPVFEATGVCPQGSKCKLHHPRKRKGTRKPSREHKNARGRYFGSSPIHMVDCRITGSEKLSERSNDDISCQDGTFVEYISLDISNEQVEQPFDSITEQTCDPGPSDAQTSTIDELIKPLRIMNKPRMADSSPAIASHSAMASTHMLEDS